MHPSRLRLGPSQSGPLTDASPGSARSPGLRVYRAAPSRRRNIHTHAPFRTKCQSFLRCRDMTTAADAKRRASSRPKPTEGIGAGLKTRIVTRALPLNRAAARRGAPSRRRRAAVAPPSARLPAGTQWQRSRTTGYVVQSPMPQPHHKRVGVSLAKRTVGLVLESLPLPHQSKTPQPVLSTCGRGAGSA